MTQIRVIISKIDWVLCKSSRAITINGMEFADKAYITSNILLKITRIYQFILKMIRMKGDIAINLAEKKLW